MSDNERATDEEIEALKTTIRDAPFPTHLDAVERLKTIKSAEGYTPSTEEVREQYWAASGEPRRDSAAEREFDRWLAARDRENRRIGWDEAKERFNDDNYRQGCICLNADHRREHPAMHWLNPYRGDNR